MCVGRFINILVLILLRHLNWIENYSTMKIGRFFFARVCVGSGHCLGFKILNFNIFWGFNKINIFWGYEDFVNIVWGYQKIGLYLGVISMHFRVFS